MHQGWGPRARSRTNYLSEQAKGAENDCCLKYYGHLNQCGKFRFLYHKL